jgi:hypothetical protein
MEDILPDQGFGFGLVTTPKLLAKILCCSNFLSANKHFDVPLGWKNPFTEQHKTLLSKKMFNIYFTISSFDGVDASLPPANAASRVTETQNLISLCSLCYVTCC